MQALTARTLRFWGVVAPLYGLILGLAVAIYVPWKSPLFSGALLAYSALWIAAGVGLFRRARWGWTLGIGAGFVGLVLMVIVCTGLVASWVYLHAIYGDFGLGASIGALLFASVGLQVLGLVPGLLLRALLRREVRADFRQGTGAVSERLPKVALALLLAPLPAGLGMHHATAYDAVPGLSAEQQAVVLAHLRARLEGTPSPSVSALAGLPVGAGPLYVTLWHDGARVARVTGEGADLAAAVAAAGDALMAHPELHGKTKIRGELKVDRVLATAAVPFADSPLLGVPVVALSVNPGLDGLQRVGAHGSAVVLPDDLLKLQAFGHAPLVPGIREMRFGLDAQGVLKRLGMAGERLERVRTEGFVSYRGASLPVVRGNTPPDALGPPGWYQAALDGGRFVLRQLQPDGRFHYQYLPYENRHPPTKPEQYSLPRHAGTVYALALLHGLTGERLFKVGAEKAIAWLDQQIPAACGSPERACVIRSGGKADLGSTALTLVGMLEYRRRTKDARYDATIRRLVAFVLSLQKEDGDFFHDFDPKADAIDRTTRSMFYSEEASLALVLAHAALGEPAWLAAAERALDFLTGPKYAGFFLGRFIYGADHWTCIAVDEAFDHLPKPGYLDFCLGYSEFIARMQYEPEGWDNADFAGHYGFGGFMVPQAPAAAGFTEAVLSTWSLAKKHGRDTAVVAAQAGAALDALTRDRIRAENAWMMPRPRFAKGGIRRSLVEQEVRIDFTQHAASALIRGAELGGALPTGNGVPVAPHSAPAG